MLITFAYKGKFYHVEADSIPAALDRVGEDYSLQFRRAAHIVNIHDPNAVVLTGVRPSTRRAEQAATAACVLALVAALLFLLALYTNAV